MPVFISMGEKINVNSLEDFDNLMSKFWKIGTVYFYFDLERSDEVFSSYLKVNNGYMVIKTPSYYKKIRIPYDSKE